MATLPATGTSLLLDICASSKTLNLAPPSSDPSDALGSKALLALMAAAPSGEVLLTCSPASCRKCHETSSSKRPVFRMAFQAGAGAAEALAPGDAVLGARSQARPASRSEAEFWKHVAEQGELGGCKRVRLRHGAGPGRTASSSSARGVHVERARWIVSWVAADDQ
jgi:hypothetical protein